jgi:hypothetical protein
MFEHDAPAIGTDKAPCGDEAFRFREFISVEQALLVLNLAEEIGIHQKGAK